MDILIVNDDGIYSPSLVSLYKALKDKFKDVNITIVAPTNQQSGIGRAISLFEPLRISKVKLDKDIYGYAVSGTPTDCVILGIYQILKKVPDLVISGINIGENLGTEIMTSGTLGAAFEAAHHGAKALASSLQMTTDDYKFSEVGIPIDFTIPAKITAEIAEKYLKYDLPCDVLNLNIPEKATLKTPVEITRLARKMYTTHVEERKDPRGRPYYWIDGYPVFEEEEDTDVYVLRKKGHISITPLTLDTTIKNLEEFKEKYKDILKI